MMNKTKRAEIVLEEVIAIGLSVVVLFLILSMFGNNLSKMLQNSSLHKAMNGDQSRKTHWETFDKNPTKTQVNVQIVADQASLAWHHSQAQQQIEKLAAITTPLTDQQTIDLAKYLTIFSQSGPQGRTPTEVLMETFELPVNTNLSDKGANYTSTQTRTLSYNDIKIAHNITVDNRAYETYFLLPSGRAKTIDWNKYNKYDTYTTKNSNELQRMKNVLAIGEAFP